MSEIYSPPMPELKVDMQPVVEMLPMIPLDKEAVIADSKRYNAGEEVESQSFVEVARLHVSTENLELELVSRDYYLDEELVISYAVNPDGSLTQLEIFGASTAEEEIKNQGFYDTLSPEARHELDTIIDGFAQALATERLRNDLGCSLEFDSVIEVSMRAGKHPSRSQFQPHLDSGKGSILVPFVASIIREGTGFMPNRMVDQGDEHCPPMAFTPTTDAEWGIQYAPTNSVARFAADRDLHCEPDWNGVGIFLYTDLTLTASS